MVIALKLCTPNFSNKLSNANSADPDETAYSSLHCLPFHPGFWDWSISWGRKKHTKQMCNSGGKNAGIKVFKI